MICVDCWISALLKTYDMGISTSTKWLGFADERLVMLQAFNSNVFEECRLHYHRLQTGIPWVKHLFIPKRLSANSWYQKQRRGVFLHCNIISAWKCIHSTIFLYRASSISFEELKKLLHGSTSWKQIALSFCYQTNRCSWQRRTSLCVRCFYPRALIQHC